MKRLHNVRVCCKNSVLRGWVVLQQVLCRKKEREANKKVWIDLIAE
jgi:hypothetical protein